MLNKDPNGLTAAVIVVIAGVATILGVTIDADDAATYAGLATGALSVVGVLIARRKTWAPDTVAALGPDTVGEPGVLPDTP